LQERKEGFSSGWGAFTLLDVAADDHQVRLFLELSIASQLKGGLDLGGNLRFSVNELAPNRGARTACLADGFLVEARRCQHLLASQGLECVVDLGAGDESTRMVGKVVTNGGLHGLVIYMWYNYLLQFS